MTGLKLLILALSAAAALAIGLGPVNASRQMVEAQNAGSPGTWAR